MTIVELGIVHATATDIIRLFVLPVFAWISYKDLQTRRIPNKVWIPVITFAITLLLIDGLTKYQAGHINRFVYVLTGTITIGGSLPYILWRQGIIGGADVKGVWCLCVLFPQYPVYETIYATYPVIQPVNGIFILAVLFNTGVGFLTVPIAIFIINLLKNNYSKHMFTAYTRPVTDVLSEHGRIVVNDGSILYTGAETELIKSYLDWRNASIKDIRNDPCSYSHPDTKNSKKQETNNDVETDNKDDVDWWCAKQFNHEELNKSIDPERLRHSLDKLQTEETIWITPSLPAFTLLTTGLLIALTFGNLLLLLL